MPFVIPTSEVDCYEALEGVRGVGRYKGGRRERVKNSKVACDGALDEG